MGNAESGPCALSSSEIEGFVGNTHFTASEIRALWFHFRSLASNSPPDDLIDRSNFQEAMRFRDSLLCDRIFSIFDSNRDGNVSFEEFIKCLSALSTKATQEEKLKFSFLIYDAAFMRLEALISFIAFFTWLVWG